MAAGTSTTLLPTVAAVMSLFGKRSFAVNDYIRIPDVPGGLIIQWGTVNGNQTFGLPITFPTKGLVAYASAGVLSSYASTGIFTNSLLQVSNSAAGSAIAFLAIGY